MANSKEKIAEFVRNNSKLFTYSKPDPDAIPRMSRMLYVDRTITDINVTDFTYDDSTGSHHYHAAAVHYQARNGTTGSVAWLLRQDPPPDINVRNYYRETPLIMAVNSDIDSEGKVRLLLDHGANRDMEDSDGNTAYFWARSRNRPAAVIDMLKNYRPDVSR